jgi:hypothetical protein
MTDDELLESYRTAGNAIVKKLNDARRDSAVTNAIETLLRRIVAGGDSLGVLREHSRHDFAPDGAVILRAIYDAMLQALYILADPAHCETRAARYLDFRWVEHHNFIDRFDKSPTYLGRRISQSPLRAGAQPGIEQEFQRVRGAFENAKGGLRGSWYEGTLRDLARAVARESEYDILQKHLSGAVHSSAFGLQGASLYQGALLMVIAWRFSFRVLGKLADYAQIELDEHERELIRRSESNVFGDPNNGVTPPPSQT